MAEEKRVQVKIGVESSQAYKGIVSFGNSVKTTFSSIINTVNKAIDSFGLLGTAISALQTGLVLKKIFDISEYAQLEKSLMAISANYGGNIDKVSMLRKELNNLAADEGESLIKLYAISQKFSNMYDENGIIRILKASAIAADATGKDIEIIADRVSQLMKMYKIGPEEAMNIVNALVASKTDLETLGLIFQRGIVKGGSSDDYRNILSFISGLNKSGVDAGRIINQFQGSISLLFDKSSKLKALGVDIYKIDPQTKKKVKKDYIEILEDLKKVLETKYGFLTKEQMVEGLDRTFGQDIGEAILFILSQIDKFRDAKKDMENAASIAAEKAKAASDTLEEQWNRLKSIVGSIKTDWGFVYDKIKGSMKYLADRPELTKDITYGIAGLSVLAGGWVLGRKGWNLIKGLGGTATGVATGKMLEEVAGVTPVYVVNWPEGFGKELPGTSRIPNIIPTIATGGKALGIAGGASLAVIGATMAYFGYRGKQIMEFIGETGSLKDFIDANKSDKTEQYRSAFIDALKGKGEMPDINQKIENVIPINITIDSNGHIITQGPDNSKITINRGNFFPTEEYSF